MNLCPYKRAHLSEARPREGLGEKICLVLREAPLFPRNRYCGGHPPPTPIFKEEQKTMSSSRSSACTRFGAALERCVCGGQRCFVAGEAEVVRSVAFAAAHREAKRSRDSFVLILTSRAETAPLALLERSHGDGDALEKIWFKYLDTAEDLAWYLNNVQLWGTDSRHPRPSLLIVDGLLDESLKPLCLLLKLIDDAATYFGSSAFVAYQYFKEPKARLLLRRFFPHQITLLRGGNKDSRLLQKTTKDDEAYTLTFPCLETNNNDFSSTTSSTSSKKRRHDDSRTSSGDSFLLLRDDLHFLLLENNSSD